MDRPALRAAEHSAAVEGLDGTYGGRPLREVAGALIDYLLSPEVQAEFPMAMFVYPARSDVELPAAFEEFESVLESQRLADPPRRRRLVSLLSSSHSSASVACFSTVDALPWRTCKRCMLVG